MGNLVSVIIPTYNSQDTIYKAIQSVLMQTYGEIEIIVIDDGSTDSTVTIVEKLARFSENIRVFKQCRSGAAAARNVGLKMANGSYIQFLDSDDVLSLNKIENQVRKLQDRDGDLVFCRTMVFVNDKDLETNFVHSANDFVPIDNEMCSYDLIRNLYGGHSVLMIQPNSFLSTKNLLDKVGFWNEELTLDDDGEYFTRVILFANKVLFDTNSVNYYRVSNPVSLSKSTNFEAFLSSKKSLLIKLSLFKMCLDDELKSIVSRNLISVFFYSYFLKYHNTKELAEIKNLLKEVGGFNRMLWPRKITRTSAYFVGNNLIFKTKLWMSGQN